jgi:hypothetical protein
MPDADARYWASYGTVALDEDLADDTERAVSFDDELGPLVEVKLDPYDVIVTCRVASSVAGSLEASWEPLVGGDEVIVVFPMGDAQGPPCIVGKLNNLLDRFPEKVAGKDARANNLSFRRMRTPHITETSELFMIRSAVTGAMVGVDETGNVTIRDGEANGIQFSGDGVAIQDADASGQLVLSKSEGFVSLWWQGTMLKMDGYDANLVAPGNVSISSSGNTPILHAMAVEQAVMLLGCYLQALAGTLKAIGPTPLTAASLAAILDPNIPGVGTPPTSPTILGSAIIQSAIPTAASSSWPGYNVPIPTSATISTALTTAFPITLVNPGVACPGLVIG